MHRQQKRRPTEVDRLNNLWVGRQGFSLLRRRPLRRFRALRAALANAHAFTQLRAPTGSNPWRGNKKATSRSRSLSILCWSIQRGASELIFSLPFMLSNHLSAALVAYPRVSPVFQKFTSSLRVNLFLLSETCLRVFKDSSKQ